MGDFHITIKIKSNSQLGRAVATSAGIFLFFSLLVFLFNDDLSVSFSVSFLLVTLYFLYASNEDTKKNIFHPLSFFIITAGLLSFGVPALLVAITPYSPASLRLPAEYLATVSILIAASFVFYIVGYRLALGLNLARVVPLLCFPKRLPKGQYIFSAFLLYGVGWLARISAWGLGLHHMNPNLGDAIVFVSSILQPLSIFATLSFFVLLWSNFERAKEKRRANPFSVLVVGLVILEVLAGLVDGSRSLMLLPLIYTAIIYNYTFRQIKFQQAVVGIIILVLVLAPLTTIYRTAYYRTLDASGASISGAADTFDRVYEWGAGPQYKHVIDSVTERLSSQLEGVLVVYQKVPRQIDFAKGGTFFPSAFLNFVPRIFWPKKPIVIPGREFAQTFWGFAIGEKYATNMGISWVGESYFNFGWFGLLVPLVLGVILRFFVVRLEAYSKFEVNVAPRLYFALFVVLDLGAFHYYPGGVVRAIVFYLIYLSILNYGFPRLLHYRQYYSYRG